MVQSMFEKSQFHGNSGKQLIPPGVQSEYVLSNLCLLKTATNPDGPLLWLKPGKQGGPVS